MVARLQGHDSSLASLASPHLCLNFLFRRFDEQKPEVLVLRKLQLVRRMPETPTIRSEAPATAKELTSGAQIEAG